MSALLLRPLDTVPADQLHQLKCEAFSDYVPSEALAHVLASEAEARQTLQASSAHPLFGFAAYRGESLVGWTQGHREGAAQFHMLNSGVARNEWRTGVYSALVTAVVDYARAQALSVVRSRHTATNSAVIIAKLKLGFHVSGFEFSEVYGPLVQLSYIVGAPRRELYEGRAAPIRPAPR